MKSSALAVAAPSTRPTATSAFQTIPLRIAIAFLCCALLEMESAGSRSLPQDSHDADAARVATIKSVAIVTHFQRRRHVIRARYGFQRALVLVLDGASSSTKFSLASSELL